MKQPPGRKRFFGRYGGRFVPEMLIPALEELEEAFRRWKNDPRFRRDFAAALKEFAGRPTPLVFAANLSRLAGGCRIFLKMEGLAHTGAHKINNVLGQILLARHMGKTRLVAETGAGQHGLATAAGAARFGMPAMPPKARRAPVTMPSATANRASPWSSWAPTSSPSGKGRGR